ncbi:hypothetical protein [Bacteroides xylanisolvens]|uniref:hypothetical protein n=1 Tax=Bacteroides xylanisolvens TaxID=371601 RepID=UPI0015F8E812|nr:hypothetical protein [Bacteroides xylanisolvens]
MSTTLTRHINVAPKRLKALKAFSLSRIPSCGGYKNPVSAVIALYQGVYEQN